MSSSCDFIRCGDNVVLNEKMDFSLKLLKNYTFFEAYEALRCAKKNTPEKADEKIIFRLIKNSDFSIFKRGDFYLQKIVINCKYNGNYKRLYLLEDVVASFCSTRTVDNHGWIYAAKYNNNWRIICGIKNGIILSRFLAEYVDVNTEIEKTKIYLRRFNIADDFDLFVRPNDNDEIYGYLGQNCNLIKPIAANNFECYQEVIAKFFYVSSFVIFLISASLHFNKHSTEFPKYKKLSGHCLEANINEKNFDLICGFIDALRNSFSPANDFILIKKLYPKIDIDKISMKKDSIEIYTNNYVDALKNTQVIQKQGENVICIKK